MNGEISLHTEMSLNDLIQDLADLPNEQLVYFIKDIDRTCACYEFTKELRDYFVKEMVKEEKAWESQGCFK